MPFASSASSRRCEQAIEDAAIVVVPSLGEGFGMVALEAMERARPVIASAVGGLPEIVADGETGLVVPPADAEALAEAIVALAGDLPRAAEMGAAARARALDGVHARSAVLRGSRSSTSARWRRLRRRRRRRRTRSHAAASANAARIARRKSHGVR